jgi:hypothetical protein
MNDIGTFPVSKQISLIALSRNLHVREALALVGEQGGATHIFWHDSDVTFPADALQRLLAHDKDIAGAFYNRRTPPYKTAGELEDTSIDIALGGLQKALTIPGGLILVRTDVYRKIASPWYFESHDHNARSGFDPDGTVGEDINFCKRAREAGFDLWVDLDLTFEIGHVGEFIVPCLRPDPKDPSPLKFTQPQPKPESKAGDDFLLIGGDRGAA